jgi:hypothetical protein
MMANDANKMIFFMINVFKFLFVIYRLKMANQHPATLLSMLGGHIVLNSSCTHTAMHFKRQKARIQNALNLKFAKRVCAIKQV